MGQHIRRTIIVLLIGILLLNLITPAAAQEIATIGNASRVNLRSGPGAGFPVVVMLAAGQQVTLLSRNADGSWVQVQLAGGTTGWVNARYVLSANPVTTLGVSQNTGRFSGVVTSSFLNVRSGPGANFDIAAKLVQGATVDLLGRNADNSWVQISVPGGVQGWVSARYISASVSIGSLPLVSNTGIFPTFPQPVPTGGQTGTVTSRGLSVRYGPGLGYGRFDILRQGEGVSLIGRNASGNWLLVQLANGSTGWVNAGFISTSFAISSLEVRG